MSDIAPPDIDQEKGLPTTVSLPCAPQPYAAPASAPVIIGLITVLVGLYATSRETVPDFIQAASGIGLSIMCFGFSVLFDSRPPASLEFDVEGRQLRMHESFFVRAMPSVGIGYDAIAYIELGEAGFRGRVPMRIHLVEGGAVGFRIAGSDTPIDDGFAERVGLSTVPPPEIDQEGVYTVPETTAGYHDPTAGLLREYEQDDGITLLWKPRAFGRAVRFRLLSVLSLVLVVWALMPRIGDEPAALLFGVLAVATIWMLYRLTRVQRQEFGAHIGESAVEINTRWTGIHVRMDRSAISRCVVALNPDHPDRYLDFLGVERDRTTSWRRVEHARRVDGSIVGIRVSVGRLTYGEAIGLAARVNLALRPDYLEHELA